MSQTLILAEKIKSDSVLYEKFCSLYFSERGRYKLADWLKIPYGSVGHVLEKVGIQSNRRERREFFRNIPRCINPFNEHSDFTEYLKGYILGDGSIGVRQGYYLYVDISSKDVDHLEKIRALWDSSIPITGPLKGCYSLRIRDMPTINSLLSMGFVPNKSRIGMKLEFPVTWPFVRGLFDSDGSISFKNKGNDLAIFWSGHWSYLREIYNFLEKFHPFVEDRGTFKIIHVYKYDYIKEIRDKMYEGATIKMQRKYERFYAPVKYRVD